MIRIADEHEEVEDAHAGHGIIERPDDASGKEARGVIAIRKRGGQREAGGVGAADVSEIADTTDDAIADSLHLKVICAQARRYILREGKAQGVGCGSKSELRRCDRRRRGFALDGADVNGACLNAREARTALIEE